MNMIKREDNRSGWNERKPKNEKEFNYGESITADTIRIASLDRVERKTGRAKWGLRIGSTLLAVAHGSVEIANRFSTEILNRPSGAEFSVPNTLPLAGAAYVLSRVSLFAQNEVHTRAMDARGALIEAYGDTGLGAIHALAAHHESRSLSSLASPMPQAEGRI